MKRAFAIIVLLSTALLVVLATRDHDSRRVTTLEGPVMGTTFHIKLVTEAPPRPEAVEQARALATRAMEDVNQKMSTYVTTSEVSRFSASDSTEPFPVSAQTLEVLVAAERIGEASRGALDPTVGPLVDLWGFGGGSSDDVRRPEDDEIEALLENIGWDKLTLDPTSGTIAKQVPGLGIDLSSVAKGYAVDRVLTALREAGYGNLMVEIGGELACIGDGPDGDGWRLGIEQPPGPGPQATSPTLETPTLTTPTLPGSQRIERVLVVTRPTALATSGEYRNWYELDGERYSHTLDPRTGRSIQHRLGSVSVLAETCLEADGWATALNVLGPDEGFAVASANDIAALFLVYNGTEADSQATVERATPAFERFLADNEQR